MTAATTAGGTRRNQAIRAPMTSAPPPNRPHRPASNHVGTLLLPPGPPAGPLAEGNYPASSRSVRPLRGPAASGRTPSSSSLARSGRASGRGRRQWGPLSIGRVAEQVPAEVRHGEGDLAALGGVDQALLDQRVARGGQRGRFAPQRDGDLRGAHSGAGRPTELGHGVHVLPLGGGGP